jgi:serine/threonine protein kinase
MTDTSVSPPLSPHGAREIDRECDRFEAAWKSGQRPDLEATVQRVSEPLRSALLRQLLLLDCDYRRRAGDAPSTADYRGRFPKHSTLIEEVVRDISAHSPSTRDFSNDPHRGPTPWTDDSPGGVDDEALTSGTGDSARYELLNEVGHGGIGIVLRGRDRELGRELAVKVLRDEFRDKLEARRRLLDEARIGSRLQHPSIVPVYDVGRFDDGRPYFTMKLIEGRTLAAMLADRSDPKQDQTRFVAIFEHVCQAMAYAHARGVIHRDLKPANVMVGAFGEVQVMDWGFAKQLVTAEPTLIHNPRSEIRNGPAVSQTGHMMGTPAFMPPEQAQGLAALVDTRSDVFALGAILCQILTGQPPYMGNSAEEICREAAEGNLQRAHARLETCRADQALCELAVRCLERERDNRPADAGIVAREVTGHLASAEQRLRQAELDRATAHARADEAKAKATAERRTRRLSLSLAGALLIGGIAAGWQAFVANRAKQDAMTAAALEKDAKIAAEARESETRSVLDFVQKRILAAAGPEGKSGGLGRDVTLRRALEAALPYLDQGFATQPLIEARLRNQLGMTFIFLGEPKTAESQFSRARVLHTQHLGADHTETLRSTSNVAISYRALGLFPEALQLDEETAAAIRARFGPEHERTLASTNNLAASYFRARRYQDALKLFREILEIQQRQLGVDHESTLNTMNNVAASLSALGQNDDALKLENQALTLRVAKSGRDHPDSLTAMSNLMTTYSSLGQHTEVFKLGEEVLALRTGKLGRGHPETLYSMTNLAAGYTDIGRHADALRLREEALPLQKVKLDADHPDVLANVWGIADCLVSLNRGAEAIPLIDDCVRRGGAKGVDPAMIPTVMALRMQHFESAKDVQGCRETAEMWEKLNRTDAPSQIQAARFRAITATMLRDSSPAMTEQVANEADQAMAWLEKAVAAGFKDATLLKSDAKLAILRDRPDFHRLVAKLASGG